MFKRVPRCGWCGKRVVVDGLPVLEVYCSEEHAANTQDRATV